MGGVCRGAKEERLIFESLVPDFASTTFGGRRPPGESAIRDGKVSEN